MKLNPLWLVFIVLGLSSCAHEPEINERPLPQQVQVRDISAHEDMTPLPMRVDADPLPSERFRREPLQLERTPASVPVTSTTVAQADRFPLDEEFDRAPMSTSEAIERQPRHWTFWAILVAIVAVGGVLAWNHSRKEKLN